MAKKINKLKSAKRFGARYGSSLKQKFAKIEAAQRSFHQCPYCRYLKVKRLSTGIWNCRKCNATFTGKAYSTSEKITTRPVEEEQPLDLVVPEEVETSKEEPATIQADEDFETDEDRPEEESSMQADEDQFDEEPEEERENE